MCGVTGERHAAGRAGQPPRLAVGAALWPRIGIEGAQAGSRSPPGNIASGVLVPDQPKGSAQALLEGGAPLGRVEGAGLDLARPEQSTSGRARGQHPLDRRRAAVPGQIVRVLPLGEQARNASDLPGSRLGRAMSSAR